MVSRRHPVSGCRRHAAPTKLSTTHLLNYERPTCCSHHRSSVAEPCRRFFIPWAAWMRHAACCWYERALPKTPCDPIKHATTHKIPQQPTLHAVLLQVEQLAHQAGKTTPHSRSSYTHATPIASCVADHGSKLYISCYIAQ